jgi:hypothetical protein
MTDAQPGKFYLIETEFWTSDKSIINFAEGGFKLHENIPLGSTVEAVYLIEDTTKTIHMFHPIDTNLFSQKCYSKNCKETDPDNKSCLQCWSADEMMNYEFWLAQSDWERSVYLEGIDMSNPWTRAQDEEGNWYCKINCQGEYISSVEIPGRPESQRCRKCSHNCASCHIGPDICDTCYAEPEIKKKTLDWDHSLNKIGLRDRSNPFTLVGDLDTDVPKIRWCRLNCVDGYWMDIKFDQYDRPVVFEQHCISYNCKEVSKDTSMFRDDIYLTYDSLSFVLSEYSQIPENRCGKCWEESDIWETKWRGLKFYETKNFVNYVTGVPFLRAGNGRCIMNCQDGYYTIRSNELYNSSCERCDHNCKKCNQNPENCTACWESSDMGPDSVTEEKWLAFNFHYGNLVAGTGDDVEEISFVAAADKRRPFTLKSDGSCILNCLSGFQPNLRERPEITNSNENQICLKCSDNCKVCVNSLSNCAECYGGNDLNNIDEFIATHESYSAADLKGRHYTGFVKFGTYCVLKCKPGYLHQWKATIGDPLFQQCFPCSENC